MSGLPGARAWMVVLWLLARGAGVRPGFASRRRAMGPPAARRGLSQGQEDRRRSTAVAALTPAHRSTRVHGIRPIIGTHSAKPDAKARHRLTVSAVVHSTEHNEPGFG